MGPINLYKACLKLLSALVLLQQPLILEMYITKNIVTKHWDYLKIFTTPHSQHQSKKLPKAYYLDAMYCKILGRIHFLDWEKNVYILYLYLNIREVPAQHSHYDLSRKNKFSKVTKLKTVNRTTCSLTGNPVLPGVMKCVRAATT